MQASIAIVIAAYNRPDSLRRLLQSIEQAAYNDYRDIPLVISIDYSGNNDCYEVAKNFVWQYGQKIIIKHPDNLKLKTHIIKCGDLTEQYDAIIMLEDDLYVSSQFYDYAQKAFSFYKNDASIAGIGLYNYRYNEFAYCPFEALTDGYDNYFMQIPCSSGQLWTTNQWLAFKQYLARENMDEENLLMPQAVLNWPVHTSWKRSFFKYMIVQDKYFIYPRISLTTNFGDVGQHYDDSVSIWQTPLLYGRRNYQFSSFEESSTIYDAFFELDARAYNRLTNKNISICFDLNGTKPLSKVNSEYFVSGKYCKQPECKYLPALYPYECNILNGVKGNTSDNVGFAFGKTVAFTEKKVFDRLNTDVSRVFFNADYLTRAAKNQVYQSLQYRIGLYVLKPFSFIQRLAHKIRNGIKL